MKFSLKLTARALENILNDFSLAYFHLDAEQESLPSEWLCGVHKNSVARGRLPSFLPLVSPASREVVLVDVTVVPPCFPSVSARLASVLAPSPETLFCGLSKIMSADCQLLSLSLVQDKHKELVGLSQ